MNMLLKKKKKELQKSTWLLTFIVIDSPTLEGEKSE
jgi:hypothetical protein